MANNGPSNQYQPTIYHLDIWKKKNWYSLLYMSFASIRLRDYDVLWFLWLLKLTALKKLKQYFVSIMFLVYNMCHILWLGIQFKHWQVARLLNTLCIFNGGINPSHGFEFFYQFVFCVFTIDNVFNRLNMHIVDTLCHCWT